MRNDIFQFIDYLTSVTRQCNVFKIRRAFIDHVVVVLKVYSE